MLLPAFLLWYGGLQAQMTEMADTVTASPGEYTTTAPESRENNTYRFRLESLPGEAKTAEEIRRLRKPRDYREKPPNEENRPIDTSEYRQKEPEETEKKEGEPFWKKIWFRNTMIGLALAAVAVLLWFLFAGTLGLRNPRQGPGTGFEDERAPEVDLAANYRALSRKAEQEGDLRAALRYRFLELLRDLHLNNWVKLEPGKTNRQYLNEARLFPHWELCRELTRAYERAWFGRIPVEAAAYQGLTKQTDDMLSRMERRPL